MAELTKKCPSHAGRGAPPTWCVPCKMAKAAYEAAHAAGILPEPTRRRGGRITEAELPLTSSPPKAKLSFEGDVRTVSGGSIPRSIRTLSSEARVEVEALQQRVQAALNGKPNAPEPPPAESPERKKPTKCRKHRTGRLPAHCAACEAVAQGLPEPEPEPEPEKKQTRCLRHRKGKPPAHCAACEAVAQGLPEPEPTANRLELANRSRQEREAFRVLREIRLMGGANLGYCCPHDEAAHAHGICTKCWDSRTRRHQFVSFLAGANRFFADLASSESTNGYLPDLEEDEAAGAYEEAAVG